MNQLNMNQLLNRTNEEKIIKDALINFEENKQNLESGKFFENFFQVHFTFIESMI